MVALSSLQSLTSLILMNSYSSSSSSSPSPSTSSPKAFLTRRKSIFFASSVLGSFLHFYTDPAPSFQFARAEEDEFEQEEEHVVQLFQETSPSVVFIKDLELVKNPKGTNEIMSTEDGSAKVEGTGSGFIWDKTGHIVTNYHVVAKLATDTSGLQRCEVVLVDANGSNFTKEGKIIGFDPAYDLAVLKVDMEGNELIPAILGTSNDLHVGQSCFAIGNPYGYENTLTTGVVSGLGREIPSPNGKAIRGAIQTDAAINSDSRSAQTCTQLIRKG
ncbi:protease Do-like 5, chloroplastic isoform X2 [Macadamia integrifolia]|uniref:protease Do-like 5, chloroplastic isoform X2 n=1 Tax=Macadamia integrifolia TaxID=60698 RepID=UPI001C533699|nr:protease Do-like 5, chloroplastic isoform X2 [Macadamia integrifolia]